MYKKILLAADGSEYSFKAAEKAIKIAQMENDSVIEVIYVVDGQTTKHDVLSNWGTEDVVEKRKERIKNIEEAAKNSKINYKITILRGEPAPTIKKYAEENNFEIIVIGSRGLNGLKSLILGSVSYSIAKTANCSVLIVK